MSVRVGMVSLGCSKNQVDAERMLYKLKEAGYELVGDAALADVVIVNTCGFIQSAKEEAIETILEFGALKKEGRIRKIIITGCLAERYRGQIAGELPEADAVVSLGCNSDIAEIVGEVTADISGKPAEHFSPCEQLALTGKRIQTTLPFYAYLKIAEGCSNRCSYCAIPRIRGKYRSVPMDELIKEARGLAEDGVRELVVIAQDTTRYGEDFGGKSLLPELLKRLCAIDGLHWIRVLYCYPERITDELLDVMASEEKLVKYLDIPIQHCNAEVLRNMHRSGSNESLRALMSHIREKVPGIILRTTLITGFPQETEEQFTELSEFVRDMRFDRLGCFTYSAEEDTPAAAMDGQIDEDIKEKRAEIIMEQQMVISAEKNEEFIGQTLEVITEGFDRYGECYFGRSAMDAPDIDGKVFFTAAGKKPVMGDLVNVKIDSVMDYDLIGEMCDESAE